MPSDPNELIAALVADLRPATPMRQSRGMAAACLALGAGALGAAALFGLRPDLMAGRPDSVAMLSAGLFLVLALATAWSVVDMARPYVGTRRDGWGWTALMAGILPVVALILIAGAWLRGAASGLEMNGMTCLKFGLLWGLLTAAALTLWLRRGAPTQPGRAGLLTGVAAGAAGIFAVSLFCPHNDLVHIGLWHGLTVVLAGIAGRLAVPRLITW